MMNNRGWKYIWQHPLLNPPYVVKIARGVRKPEKKLCYRSVYCENRTQNTAICKKPDGLLL